jgi:hypothetical protein
MDKERALARLHLSLGLERLNPLWAKLEIVLGLFAAGIELFLGNGAGNPSGEMSWTRLAAGLCLFVLGSYLTLAGHRSHLHQSNNQLAAYLAEEIRDVLNLPAKN